MFQKALLKVPLLSILIVRANLEKLALTSKSKAEEANLDKVEANY